MLVFQSNSEAGLEYVDSMTALFKGISTTGKGAQGPLERVLFSYFKSKGQLQNSHYICVQETMTMFIVTLSHNTRNRVVKRRFNHSLQTIHFYFMRVTSDARILKGNNCAAFIRYKSQSNQESSPSAGNIQGNIEVNSLYYLKLLRHIKIYSLQGAWVHWMDTCSCRYNNSNASSMQRERKGKVLSKCSGYV